MIVRTSWQCVPPRKASFMMKMSPSWIALLADPLDDGLDRVRQRADVRREVVLALRDHAPVGVADGGAEVAALADDERVADALEHQPHLVDDAHEGVAQHLERDRVDLPRPDVAVAHRETSASGWSVITMLPTASTRGARAGRQDDGAVELLDDAGAVELVAGARPVRSRTRRRDPAVPVEVHLPLARGQRLARRCRRARRAQVGLLALPARRHAQRRGLDRRLGMRVAVLAQVLVVEARDGAAKPLVADLGERHRDRVELPDVAEVDGVLDGDLGALRRPGATRLPTTRSSISA